MNSIIVDGIKIEVKQVWRKNTTGILFEIAEVSIEDCKGEPKPSLATKGEHTNCGWWAEEFMALHELVTTSDINKQRIENMEEARKVGWNNAINHIKDVISLLDR